MMHAQEVNRLEPVQEELCWHAVMTRQRAADGSFVFAVRSTGIYCRPSCPSRRPRRDRVQFFSRPDEAERAGFRACLRCRPRDANVRMKTVESICQFLQQHTDGPVTLAALSKPSRVAEAFGFAASRE